MTYYLSIMYARRKNAPAEPRQTKNYILRINEELVVKINQ